MQNLGEESEFLRLALGMGLVTVDTVVRWADDTIAALPQPSIQLIDVSLSGSRPADEIMELLARIPGSRDTERAVRETLGMVLHRLQVGELELDSAMTMLLTLCSNADTQIAGIVFHWADEFNCAQRGYYGSIESVRENVVQFLREHAGAPPANWK